MNKHYFIKEGYRINTEPGLYHDSEKDALTYQMDVYRYAATWAKKIGANTLLDIGCGYGLKRAQFIRPLGIGIVGIDEEHAINYCNAHHTFGRWFADDVEHPQLLWDGAFDLIISADVIEHLVDPDTLLSYMRHCSHDDTYMIISTPERDLRRGPESMGPPQNPAHIRDKHAPSLSVCVGEGWPGSR